MTMPLVFETASKLWRDRVISSQDYSVVRNDRVSLRNFFRAPVLESEYRAAVNYKTALLRLYRGMALEEVFPGRIIGTSEGDAYCISRQHALEVPPWDGNSARRALLSDLSLVYGIGERTGKMA